MCPPGELEASVRGRSALRHDSSSGGRLRSGLVLLPCNESLMGELFGTAVLALEEGGGSSVNSVGCSCVGAEALASVSCNSNSLIRAAV